MKRAYLVLAPLKLNTPIETIYPEGMVHICGVFRTKKLAKKFADDVEIYEVMIK